MTAPGDSIIDATQLARWIAEGQLSTDRHNEAWEKLSTVVDQVAKRVAKQCRCDKIVAEANSFIYDRLDPHSEYHGAKYDPAKCKKFECWCETVLTRRVIDIKKRDERIGVLPDQDEYEAGSPEGPDDWFSVHCQRREEMRALLDKLRTQWPVGKSKYYSVFLFQLSWVIGFMIRSDSGWSDAVCDGVGVCLPWGKCEREASLNADWPTWGKLWDSAACPLFDTPGPRPTIKSLCTKLSKLTPTKVGVARWIQWVKRSKNFARELLTEEEWDAHFARFFPDRNRPAKDS